MVNVYNENGEVVAQVKYNNNLDVWDGHNCQNGGIGLHKGLTWLTNNKFVLIYGTQWPGQEDHAEIISEEQAIQEIIKAGKDELLDTFNLREKAEKILLKEKEIEE
jgi:hypothetical protein